MQCKQPILPAAFSGLCSSSLSLAVDCSPTTAWKLLMAQGPCLAHPDLLPPGMLGLAHGSSPSMPVHMSLPCLRSSEQKHWARSSLEYNAVPSPQGSRRGYSALPPCTG